MTHFHSDPIPLPKRGGKRSIRENIGIELAQRAAYKIVAKFKIIYNNNLGYSNGIHGGDLDICSVLPCVLTKSHVYGSYTASPR